MASGITGSPCAGFAEIERQILPSAVWHALADMLELVAGMGLMARPTGSPAPFLVDVQKMQILVAIAEIRQPVGGGRLNQCPFMTAKTQLIFRLIE